MSRRCAAQLAAFALAAVVIGCGKTDSPVVQAWSGGLITRVGTYAVAPGSLVVTVWVDEERLLKYSIADGAGGRLFATTNRPSALANWFLHLDEANRLWVHSGDIGSSVVLGGAGGDCRELFLHDRPDLIRRMPEEFFERLPDGVRRKWAPHRQGMERIGAHP